MTHAVQLGDIIQLRKGKKASEVYEQRVNGAKPYIQIDEVRGAAPQKYAYDVKGVTVTSTDLCIVWDGANAGTVGYGVDGLIGSTVARMRIKVPEEWDTEFVGRLLQSRFRQLNDEAQARGATIPHVDKSKLESIELPRIDRSEQRRIASILSKADSIRQKREKLISLAEEMLRAQFLEAFGDPRSVGSSGISLSDVASISRGRFSPRPRNDPRYYNGAYPFIQTAEIAASDGYTFQYRQTLNDDGIKVSKGFPAGTVFIAIVGATIGATAVSGREFWCPDSVIGIVPNSSDYPAEFLEYLLRFWRPVFVDQAPETARANINLQTLKPVPIPLCRDGEAVRFAKLYKELHALKQKIRKLDDELFLSLSQRAFRGEL